jgi:hypothetical protein
MKITLFWIVRRVVWNIGNSVLEETTTSIFKAGKSEDGGSRFFRDAGASPSSYAASQS